MIDYLDCSLSFGLHIYTSMIMALYLRLGVAAIIQSTSARDNTEGMRWGTFACVNPDMTAELGAMSLKNVLILNSAEELAAVICFPAFPLSVCRR